jgi:hypothetical protein
MLLHNRICLTLCPMQLGDGTTIQGFTPKAVPGISGAVTAVAAGFSHTCAITASGVICWGDNNNGQVNRTRSAPSGVLLFDSHALH